MCIRAEAAYLAGAAPINAVEGFLIENRVNLKPNPRMSPLCVMLAKMPVERRAGITRSAASFLSGLQPWKAEVALPDQPKLDLPW